MKKLSNKQQVQEDEYFFPYHYLDLYLESYRDLYFINRNELINTIKEILKVKETDLILDACCGDGRFSYELKKTGANVVGVDYSKRAIEFAKIFNNDHKNFHSCDLKKFKYSKKFDKIVLMESLEHFAPKEIPLFLKNINKLLKKDGKFIITVTSDKLTLPEKHYQHFSPKKLNEILQDYFEVEKILGYSSLGKKRIIYNFLEKFGRFLLPVKNKWFFKKYFSFLKKYYINNFSIGDKNNSLGLIAICKNN